MAFALVRMIRVPDLLIIALTMILARYGIIAANFQRAGAEPAMPDWQFVLLVVASIMIAAAGYIVNDVLDAGIDEVNKPGRNLVGSPVSEKTANLWYYVLNIVGVSIGVVLSFLAGKIQVGIIFLLIATALYFYSYKYKYLAFWGNFTVSILSAMVILIVWIFEFFHLRSQPDLFTLVVPEFYPVVRLLLGYAAFAFLVSMAREMVKDIQDLEGDTRFGCRTIPVLLGVARSRIIAMALTALIMAALGSCQALLLQQGQVLLFAGLFVPQALMLLALVQMARAREAARLRPVAATLRLTMVAGVLTMILAGL